MPAAERAAWERIVVAPLMVALSEASALQAESIAAAALPPLLDAQPAALRWVLEHASHAIAAADGDGGGAAAALAPQQSVRLLLAVLKTARRTGCCRRPLLVAADAALASDAWPVVGAGGRGFLLASALLGEEEQLALDALELVCVTAKASEAAGAAEMELLRAFLPLRLKGATPNSRKHIVDAMRRWLTRLRASSFRSANLQRELQQLDAAAATPSAARPEWMAAAAAKREYAAACRSWLDWYASLLVGSLYPGAPYERAMLALELYASLLEVWEPADASAAINPADASEDPRASLAYPLTYDLRGGAVAARLLRLLMADFDAIRAAAYELLRAFPPGPLPGVESPAALGALVGWALPLLQSARVHESDAAAFVLRLAFQRYVLGLRWTVVLGGVGGGALRADVARPLPRPPPPRRSTTRSTRRRPSSAVCSRCWTRALSRGRSTWRRRPTSRHCMERSSCSASCSRTSTPPVPPADLAVARRAAAVGRRRPPRCARVSQLALGPASSDPSRRGLRAGRRRQRAAPRPGGLPRRPPPRRRRRLGRRRRLRRRRRRRRRDADEHAEGKLEARVVLCWLAIKEASLLVGQAFGVEPGCRAPPLKAAAAGRRAAARAARRRRS